MKRASELYQQSIECLRGMIIAEHKGRPIDPIDRALWDFGTLPAWRRIAYWITGR